MTSTQQKTIILNKCGPCSDFASLTLAFALQQSNQLLSTALFTDKSLFPLSYPCFYSKILCTDCVVRTDGKISRGKCLVWKFREKRPRGIVNHKGD